MNNEIKKTQSIWVEHLGKGNNPDGNSYVVKTTRPEKQRVTRVDYDPGSYEIKAITELRPWKEVGAVIYDDRCGDTKKMAVKKRLPKEVTYFLDKSKIDVLFRLADKAKNIGNYDTPNEIFSYLFHLCAIQAHPYLYLEYEYFESEFKSEWGWSHVDEHKELEEEHYMDLVVVRSKIGGYLCIPAPLLSTEAFNMLSGQMEDEIPRRQHQRQSRENALAEYHEVLEKENIPRFEIKDWVLHQEESR